MDNIQLDLFEFNDLPFWESLILNFSDFESDELEYKSAQGGFPVDFWKTYSAFANTNGGVILLGVKEKKNQFIIEGFSEEQINLHKKVFWDSINNPKTVNLNLVSEENVKVLNVEGKKILAFRIPSAKRNQKPVYLTSNPFDNTYKRNYEGDYKCTREEVRRMLSDADSNNHPDSRILEGYSINDIDLNSLKQYRQLLSNTRSSHPWLSLGDIEFLEKLGGYRKDRASKMEGFTLAGVLMFGKDNSITDNECVPNYFPDYREIMTTDPEIRWTDRVYPDGTWECNLFQFYLKVWPRLSASMPKPFQLKGGVRQDETPAHVALREAFVNALIHTDYSAPGNIVIEHRMNNFQFSNPGTLLVSLQQYYSGGISECRNTSIQKMFLMIGSAEKAGSGVNKIIAGWEYAHWRTPYLQIFPQPDRLVLELPMFSILPEETLNDLRRLYGEDIDGLGKDELTILATCHIEGEISNNRLQYMIDKHPSDITKILQELSKQGYLESESKGRWTLYHLNTQKQVQNTPTNSTQNLDTFDTNLESSNLDSLGTPTPVNLDSSKKEKHQNLDSFDTNLESSKRAKRSNLESSKKLPKKLTKEALETIILEYCKDEYHTLDEIASTTERKASYIQNEIIPLLISSGKLVRQYPNTLNHPNQAYKKASEL